MEEILKKICLSKDDIKEFVDLIEINDSKTGLGKRYELLQAISGEKVKHRFENLIEACWSAKDWFIDDINNNFGEGKAKKFEYDLYKVDSASMIQYLANSRKHRKIGNQRLKENKYKDRLPRLDKVVLVLSSNSVPGLMKPTFRSVGDVVPPFEISGVRLIIGGVAYDDFDTIILSMSIVDKDNKVIGDAMDEVNKYILALKEITDKIEK